MNFLSQTLSLLAYIWNHPGNRKDRVASLFRFFRWQMRKRIAGKPLIIDLEGGRLFKILPDSKFSSLVYYTGLPDWDEMNFLMRILRRNDAFLDIGANVGFYTLLASTKVTAERIYAVEANPSNVAVIQEQLMINNLYAVQVFPFAVGAEPGTVLFQATDRETGTIVAKDGRHTFSVEVKTLDSLLTAEQLPDTTIAKMDVEGCEIDVLLGSTDLLRSGKISVWLFELSDENLERRGGSAKKLLDVFHRSGYVIYFWDEINRELSPLLDGAVRQNYIACSRGIDWLKARLN